MFRRNSSLKISIYFLLLILLIFSSCIVSSKKTVEQITGELFFGIPELIQQEIITEDLNYKEEYKFYKSYMEKGPVIPGIFQGAVPQGMAYYQETDLMLISNYMFDGRPSCITAVSMTDGLLKKTLWFLNPDGTPHMGHVGGLAISKKYLWIASGEGVYYISLESFRNHTDNTNLQMTAFVQTAVKGSFAAFSEGILWIGEFTSRDGSYNVPGSHHFKAGEDYVNHGWLAGFILDRESDLIVLKNIIADVSYPDYILSIPHEVQGAVFSTDKIIFSRSYGRNNNSRISVYSNPMNEISHSTFITEENWSIPVWILDKNNLEEEITAPSMSEGISNYKGAISVLYESGSDKYRSTAKNTQDRIHIFTQLP
jgi:hypothetical protein